MNIKKIIEDLRTLADDLEGAMTEKEEKPEQKKASHTLEDIRALLAEKSKAGFTSQVRETIAKHGGDKLSTVPESNYDALYEDALKIGGES